MHPAEQIDQLIERLVDWRGEMLAQIRQCFLAADQNMTEEWKWKGSPTWYCDGMIAVANAHKDKVKVTFSHGASLDDPGNLFNAGLGGKVWRAIDFYEDGEVDAEALMQLIRCAIDYNRSRAAKTSK